LGKAKKYFFPFFPTWEKPKNVLKMSSQLGKSQKKFFSDFPKLGKSQKCFFPIFPTWEGIFPLAGHFPNLGKTKKAAPPIFPNWEKQKRLRLRL
jgi:hypothetical protein